MKYWPSYTTPNEKTYTLKHVRVLEPALALCQWKRTAVQAGGSIGYFPLRMARDFDRVITFEPESLIRECLAKNLADFPNVEVRPEALGGVDSTCAIERRGFGSHFVIPGSSVDMITLDSLELKDVDLIQLDIEGYEICALRGAEETIDRCQPIIQVEILERSDGDEVRAFFKRMGYFLTQSTGRDYVFRPRA